jgi:hypothetical protein
VSGHNFVGYREWDGRIVKEERTELRSRLHRPAPGPLLGRQPGGPLPPLYPNPTPLQTLDMARMRAYGGYTYVLFGEFFCQSPLRENEAAVTSPS